MLLPNFNTLNQYQFLSLCSKLGYSADIVITFGIDRLTGNKVFMDKCITYIKKENKIMAKLVEVDNCNDKFVINCNDSNLISLINSYLNSTYPDRNILANKNDIDLLNELNRIDPYQEYRLVKNLHIQDESLSFEKLILHNFKFFGNSQLLSIDNNQKLSVYELFTKETEHYSWELKINIAKEFIKYSIYYGGSILNPRKKIIGA